jgi:hypothetical protein
MDGLFSPNRTKLIRKRKGIKVEPEFVLNNLLPWNMPGIPEAPPAPRKVNTSPGFKPNIKNENGIRKFNLGPAAGNRGPALHPAYAAASASGRVSPSNRRTINIPNNKNSKTSKITKKKKCCTMLGGGVDDDDHPSLFVPATNATCSLPSNRSSNKRRETRRRR